MNDSTRRVVNVTSAVQYGHTPQSELTDHPDGWKDRRLIDAVNNFSAALLRLSGPSVETHGACQCEACGYVGDESEWDTVRAFKGNREQPSEWEWKCPLCGRLGDFLDVRICDGCDRVIDDEAAHDDGRCMEARDAE